MVVFPNPRGSHATSPLPPFRARWGDKKGHRWREVSRKRRERRKGEAGEEKDRNVERKQRWREVRV